MKTLTFLLQTDTLQAIASSEDTSLWWLWLILACFILYFFLKMKVKHNEKIAKLKQQAEEDRVNLLTELLKDKQLPYFKIKGITQYEPKKPGCYICQLVAEPENPYDKLAVKIVHPTIGMIGHISKGNEYIHNLAKEKTLLGATQLGYHGGRPYGKFFIDPSVFSVEDINQMNELCIND